jgi:AraC-like DNA-binding protein
LFPKDDPGWLREKDPPVTRAVGALTAVPGIIRSLGADPGPILAAAGLDPGALDDPAGRLPYGAFARLLAEAAARTRCEHFGLLAGAAWHLADLGIPGEVIRFSPTVSQGLEEFVVHQHLNSGGGVAFLVQRDGFADLGYAIHVPVPVGTAHVYDGVMAAATNFLRELCGESWNPSEVLLPHSPPANAAPFRQHFRAPVRFNSEFAAVRFPVATLDRPNAGSDPPRLRMARAKARTAGKATLVHLVARALRTLLLHGRNSGDDVAQALAMHRRTLNRRLSAEGHTFQQVLDRVRFTVAKELLGESDVPIPAIAASLGYADYVAFTRAFRRWTGATPGAWRKSTRAAVKA